MAEALLRQRLADRGIDGVLVSSAGTWSTGARPTPETVAVVEELGGDLSRHRGQRVDGGLVASADLVVAMTGDHLLDLAHEAPGHMERVFKLSELARLVAEVGPRRAGESLREYASRLGRGRPARPWGASYADPDIADPVGEPLDVYRKTAGEISRLLDAIVEGAWPRLGA